MPTQGPLNPTAATTSNSNGGTQDWTNPTNVFAEEGSNASAPSSGIGPTLTFYLIASGFGFTIPAGATSFGITVRIVKGGSGTGVKDASVYIQSGGTLGLDKADLITNWTTPDSAVTYGGSGDSWGQTWTPALLNDSAFAVVISATLPTSSNGLIDHIRVTIDYTDTAASPPTRQHMSRDIPMVFRTDNWDTG